MTIMTTQPTTSLSLGNLFYQLVSGQLTPDPLWKCKRFRLKFALRTLAYPVTTCHYLRQLAALPQIGQLLSIQGLLPAKPHRPYLCAGFNVAQRAQALLDHYILLDQLRNSELKQILLSPESVRLASFHGKNNEFFQLFCCSGHFDREGEVTLTLQVNNETIASLSFSLLKEKGVRTLLIGGLQGPRKNITSEVIREATKACHGLFPKRLLLEVVCKLAACFRIQQILAVGDETHVFRSLRYRHSKRDYFFASYSEFWRSLAGECRKDGLFHLPLAIERKLLTEIASKKRAEYRRRYALLDDLAGQLDTL